MAATSKLLVEDIIVLFVVVLDCRSAETVIPQASITALLVCQRGCFQFKLLAPAPAEAAEYNV
jgi:hypothetical protein